MIEKVWTRDRFGRCDYLAAQMFLSDARQLWKSYANFFTYHAEYEKPDGSRWYEYLRDLEGNEFDYCLTKRPDGEA